MLSGRDPPGPPRLHMKTPTSGRSAVLPGPAVTFRRCGDLTEGIIHPGQADTAACGNTWVMKSSPARLVIRFWALPPAFVMNTWSATLR